MATKIIKQFYFTSKDIMAWEPTESTKNIMEGVEIKNFTNYYITQISIQGLPGVKFYFDNSADTLILNGLGYFDLDLTGTGATINNVYFDIASAQSRARNNPKGYLIVDVILETENPKNGGEV